MIVIGNLHHHLDSSIGIPDWAAVHRELKRKHVTLSVLWEEYSQASKPAGAETLLP
ncbi:hypothetical protein [Bradyrhizobium elkanii]|uniref:hypothetical protein n=1 Tax=Bradyrhizobium elkanii TaxID=29448 RepID=UPI0004AC924C|nr:hypothetical protein [Bradyrhizobium elkanii]